MNVKELLKQQEDLVRLNKSATAVLGNVHEVVELFGPFTGGSRCRITLRRDVNPDLFAQVVAVFETLALQQEGALIDVNNKVRAINTLLEGS